MLAQKFLSSLSNSEPSSKPLLSLFFPENCRALCRLYKKTIANITRKRATKTGSSASDNCCTTGNSFMNEVGRDEVTLLHNLLRTASSGGCRLRHQSIISWSINKNLHGWLCEAHGPSRPQASPTLPLTPRCGFWNLWSSLDILAQRIHNFNSFVVNFYFAFQIQKCKKKNNIYFFQQQIIGTPGPTYIYIFLQFHHH